MNAYRWVMEEPGKPLTKVEFEPDEPDTGEVVVAIAGCGVCHTDLGFYYDGVRTRHPLPLTLGHEISGRVVSTGSSSAQWQDKTVIIPAVISCALVICVIAVTAQSARVRNHRASICTEDLQRISRCQRWACVKSIWPDWPQSRWNWRTRASSLML